MAGADDRPVRLPPEARPGQPVSWPTEWVGAIYRRSIDTWLREPSIRRRLAARPGVSEDDVRARMFLYENVQAALQPCREAYEGFLDAVIWRERGVRAVAGAFWRAELDLGAATATLLPIATLLLGWWFGVPFWLLALLLLASLLGAAGVLVADRLAREQLVRLFAVSVSVVGLMVVRPYAWNRANRWGREQTRHGTGPVLRRVVDELIGEDVDSLLLPDSFEGLRSPRGEGYHVSNRPLRQLRRKMAQMDGGTIAVSGPRGVGKTTLLQHAVDRDDFVVLTHAPAAYAPHDFLLSLFVEVGERYLRREGRSIPDLARLPRRTLRRVRRPLVRFGRWLGFALPAAALVVLGLVAAARSLQEEHGGGLERRLADLGRDLRERTLDVWQGQSVGPALAVACAGVAVWSLRRAGWFGTVVPFLVRLLGRLLALALVLGALASLTLDPEVRHAVAALPASWFSLLLLPSLLFAVGLVVEVWAAGWKWLLRRSGRAPVRVDMDVFLVGILLVALAGLLAQEPGRALLTDPDNPPRLLVLLTGVALWRLASRPWRLGRSESVLVRRCRDQLYRLQTAQTASTATNAGGVASPLLTLGASHTATVATVPPNYPVLVADFKELLGDIAAELAGRGQRTVIVIDEVDRLGSAEQALAFLREIKAVLGVPHVHYLISVADDVGATFVRRGLPHRDVTDSSLNDVVHVGPATLAESAALLTERAPGISDPYVLLAHALSGGLPRDLIRYARRLLEIQQATDQLELPDIARAMILEEVHETLDGFHTLLARQRWTPDTGAVLGLFRDLMGHLRTACPCPDRSAALGAALTHFARPLPPDRPGDELPDDARLLLDEAAVYAYFSLTLLEVFGRPGFSARRASANLRGPDGAPETLADTRRELAVSPYSARPLIDAVRAAWALAVLGAGPAGPAPPRSVPCRQHG